MLLYFLVTYLLLWSHILFLTQFMVHTAHTPFGKEALGFAKVNEPVMYGLPGAVRWNYKVFHFQGLTPRHVS